MSEGGSTVNNTAGADSIVGIQADHVHNSNVYMVQPNDSPREKYEVGIHFLDNGVPARARELIHEAMAHGHDTSEVRFHYVLAMLSKRAYRDLTVDEREALAHTLENLERYRDDEWTRALQAICDILDRLNGSGTGRPERDDLADVRPTQREKIVRHLDLVLDGWMKDNLWDDTKQWADAAGLAGDRVNRVWAYFHPEPAEPKVRKPSGNLSTGRDKVLATLCGALSSVAAGYVGWLVALTVKPLPMIALVLAAAAGCVAVRDGFEWYYRYTRLHDCEREYRGQRGVWLDGDRLASDVDRSFKYYFARYSPEGVAVDRWLEITAGVRAMLRTELIETYETETIESGEATWLIRYMARDVRKCWTDDSLWSYRQRYRITPTTIVRCLLALVVLVAATIVVIEAAVQVSVVVTLVATAAAVVTGRVAVQRLMLIARERRRLVEDHEEQDRLMRQRQTEFDRWTARLRSTRPSEKEMEDWLTADKTIVLDQALRHYRLAWRDIIAHAFLQTPAKNYKRARIERGPWRYSKYDIRLFLITHDGVREVSTELDFEQAVRRGEERNNFRFDAVSSVYVATADRLGYALRLTLTNGPTRDIRVTDPVRRALGPEENEHAFTEINLDAAGFGHTLHILEGIAAEGKGWLRRDPHTAGHGAGQAGSTRRRRHPASRTNTVRRSATTTG